MDPRTRRNPTRTRRLAFLAIGVVTAGLLTGGLVPSWAAETNLALGKPATGSAACQASESADKAVNGSTTQGNSDKFCSAAAPMFLQVDLGSAQRIGSFAVQHASSGGEDAGWNTSDFTISVGTDGTTWHEVVTVTGNTAGTTTHPVDPVTARYLRLDVTTPTGTGDGAMRIYEFEAYPVPAGPSPSPSASCHPDAPANLTDYLNGHGHAMTRIACNADVAIYFDPKLLALPSAGTAWVTGLTTEVWRYMKDEYGSCAVPRAGCERFGDPRPAIVFYHYSPGGGSSGTIRFRFDGSTGNRATIGVDSGDWAATSGLDEMIIHEACHHPEFDGQGMLDSPAYNVWGDSKWAKYCMYDFMINTGRTADAEDLFARLMRGRDNLPAGATNVAWFRDWFYPLWQEGGGKPEVMGRFFELLAKHFPSYNYGSYGQYARRMNAGEYVHFTSAAAGKDLSARAATVFNSGYKQAEFDNARKDFPALTY